MQSGAQELTAIVRAWARTVPLWAIYDSDSLGRPWGVRSPRPRGHIQYPRPQALAHKAAAAGAYRLQILPPTHRGQSTENKAPDSENSTMMSVR